VHSRDAVEVLDDAELETPHVAGVMEGAGLPPADDENRQNAELSVWVKSTPVIVTL
jgi:hypothetical protein